MRTLDTVPANLKKGLRNNGGGHYNHSLFWESLSPKGGGEPEGKLIEAMNRTFGSFNEFVSAFSAEAVTCFGSGWAWLVSYSKGKLAITSTANQDNPISRGLIPLLGVDVWEHAYYLKYQNRRPEYFENTFHIIHWKTVENRYLSFK